MQLSDLDYSFPEELIATEPVKESRILFHRANSIWEGRMPDLINEFEAGDVLVINDSKVVKMRIFARQILESGDEREIEVLFLKALAATRWQVLMPSSRVKDSHRVLLPTGIELKLLERGKPQVVELSESIDFSYFARYGELPLPPYIQKARGNRHEREQEEQWYQTAWAEKEGSAAAPTASLHFREEHLQALRQKGVQIVKLTLHVGIGTFLPVEAEDLKKHQMHREWIDIPKSSLATIAAAKQAGKRVFALGTTVTRSLESYAQGLLQEAEHSFQGESDLFIYPPYSYQVVDVLLTNFHQPKTTLMALVAAFSSVEEVMRAYRWAIERRFRLFSYGDLSVWIKK